MLGTERRAAGGVGGPRRPGPDAARPHVVAMLHAHVRARRSALALLACTATVAGCGGSGGHRGPTASSPTAGGKAAASTPNGARAITVVGRQRRGTRVEDWTLRT